MASREYRSGSNFDVEVVLLVGHLEHQRPRKMVDADVVTVNNQTAAADAHFDLNQLRILATSTHAQCQVAALITDQHLCTQVCAEVCSQVCTQARHQACIQMCSSVLNSQV